MPVPLLTTLLAPLPTRAFALPLVVHLDLLQPLHQPLHDAPVPQLPVVKERVAATQLPGDVTAPALLRVVKRARRPRVPGGPTPAVAARSSLGCRGASLVTSPGPKAP